MYVRGIHVKGVKKYKTVFNLEKPEYLTRISANRRIKNPNIKKKYFDKILFFFLLNDNNKKEQIKEINGIYIGIPIRLEIVSVIAFVKFPLGQFISNIDELFNLLLKHFNKKWVEVSWSFGVVIVLLDKLSSIKLVFSNFMLFNSPFLFWFWIMPLNNTNSLFLKKPFLASIVVLTESSSSETRFWKLFDSSLIKILLIILSSALMFSTKNVTFLNESLKLLFFITEETEFSVDELTNDLDLFKAKGVINVEKMIWIKSINNEIRKKRFINFILFNPVVHKIISSFCLSNFTIDSVKANKKESGINFVIILVIL